MNRRLAAAGVLVAGGLAALALLLTGPASVVAAEQDIVVADFHAFGGPGGLIRVDLRSGARRTVSESAAPVGGPAFSDPGDVALEPGGSLLVADFEAFGGGGGLIRVDPVTGARTTVSANDAPSGAPAFSDPSGIAVLPGGDILVADRGAFGGGGGVIRVDPATGARTAVSNNAAPLGEPSFVEPAGIALAPDGDVLVADEDAFGGSGGLIRVDPATGARTTLSENSGPIGGPSFLEPVGMAFGADGSLLVTDEDAFGGTGGVMRVDVATGARATLSANGAPAGGPDFAQPYGIAVTPEGSILVADFDAYGGNGGVIRVDPATGARSRLSANEAPVGGPQFLDPLGIALVPPLPAASSPPVVAPKPPPARDITAPVISSASVRPRRFSVGGGSRGGTSFRYRLSEPARVTFALQRRLRGRRVGGRCRRETRTNRRRPACTRHVRAGGFSHGGVPGANRRRFGGRIRGRRLRPGAYRATLRATDSAGNRSRPRRLLFRVAGG